MRESCDDYHFFLIRHSNNQSVYYMYLNVLALEVVWSHSKNLLLYTYVAHICLWNISNRVVTFKDSSKATLIEQSYNIHCIKNTKEQLDW